MAPLQPQLVPVSLAHGLDTKTDPKQVATGRLLVLENAVFTSPGMLRKRYGQKSLTSPASTGYGLATFRSELVSWSGLKLYSLASANGSQVNKGTFQSPILSTPWAVKNAYTQSFQDGAISSDGLIRVYAYDDSRGGVWYSVVDTASGQVITEAQLTATGDKCRCVQLGPYVAIFWRNSSDLKLYVKGIPSANPTNPTTSTAIVTTMNAGTPAWCVVADGNKAFLAWNTNVATTVSFAYVDTTLTLTGPVTQGTVTINTAMDLAISASSYVSFTWYDGTNVRQMVRSYQDLSAVSASFIVEAVANVGAVCSYSLASLGGSANNWQVAYTVSGASSDKNKLRFQNTLNGAVTGGAQDIMRGVQLAAKPFAPTGSDAIIYPVEHQEAPQSTYFLVRSDGIAIARYCAGTAAQGVAYYLPQTTTDGTYWHQALQVQTLFTPLVDNTGTSTPSVATGASALVFGSSGIQGALFNFFNQQSSFSSAEIGQSLIINGGMGWQYDGKSVVEQGFHQWPAIASTTSAGSGTSKTSGAVYWYAAVYEWVDSQGIRHQSNPSFAVSYTAASNNDVNVVVSTLRNTVKAKVGIGIYRTIANGTTFYRVNPMTNTPFNDTTVDTITYSDSVTDATIQYGEALYTLGGVLENDPIPAAKALTTWGGRLAYIPSEGDSLTYGISKRVGPGDPVQGSAVLLYPVDPRGGVLTALGAIDDKLVLFKKTSIFIQVGHGPTDAGTDDDLAQNPAQLLTTDVGCTNQKSVVVTPEGLMFQSTKGIFLLNRSLQTSYVGAPVEAYNSDTVVSAALIPSQNQVRFGLASGKALVYDYFMKEWAVFTNYSQVAAVNWQDLYTVLRSSGVIRQEDPTTFTDVGQAINMRLTTSWLSLAGLQGYQRVWKVLLLGTWKSTHQLLVGLAYDFDDSQTQTDTISPANPGTWGSSSTWGSDAVWGGGATPYQFEVQCRKQKCQAIQVTVSDTGSTGEAMSLSALTFLVGVNRGPMRLPAAQKYG